MSLGSIFNIAGSALTAETARLTASAGNLSNANIEAGNPDAVYKAQYPVFQAIQEGTNKWIGEEMQGGVKLKGTYESKADPTKRYSPDNPLADANGFIYMPNIDYVEEMANVISAAKSYQMNIEVAGTAKQLIQRTLQLGE